MNWNFLESLPGLTAVPTVWRRQLGEDYEGFRQLCLQEESWRVEEEVGEVQNVQSENPKSERNQKEIRRPKAEVAQKSQSAVSQVSQPARAGNSGALGGSKAPADLADLPSSAFPLALADITPLRVNRARLAREICRALGLECKFAEMPVPNTFQAGSWSTDAVPVLVSIPTESQDLRQAVAELALRLQRPFILMAPTSHLLTAPCDELLAHARAGFFALSSIVTLTPHGALVASRPPGELFARFAPQPKDTQDTAARQLFALAKALDSGPGLRKAPPSAVLRLYCVEALGADQIARHLRCNVRVVYRRLDLLSQKLGRNLAELRQYSSQFQSIEESLSDPRARSIYRKGAVTGDEEDQEDL